MPGPSWFADDVLTRARHRSAESCFTEHGRLGYTDQAWCSAGRRARRGGSRAADTTAGAAGGTRSSRTWSYVPVWTDHLKVNASLKARLDEVFWHGRARCLGHLGNEPILRATRVPALQPFVYVFHDLNRILWVQLDKFIQTLRDLKHTQRGLGRI
ncbi:hypothetical protein BC826DRAFT_1043552, partial [Russula brevipes]